MRFARGLLIFSCGLFTLGAQTLLFREFTTAFEGNDISVGVFFAAWFFWIGLGALLIRRWNHLADLLLRHIESLFLLYVPAFVGQILLIVQVRELAGVASYDLMSIQTIVLWAMIVSAPVSFVTGALFPLACRWIEQMDSFPISRVYILEALGSFAGGLAVTALLACHVQTVRVFFLLALIIFLSVCLAGLGRVGAPKRGSLRLGTLRCAHHSYRLGVYVSLPLSVLCVVGIATGIDGRVAQQLRALKWSKLLPPEALEGSFSTAQAEYLYGRYHGQWIAVREGSVCEALPNEEEAGQTAALALCQNPQAERALVIGSGLAVCNRLLVLPQMQEVAWASTDPEYMKWLLRHVPSEFRTGDRRFHPIEEELRRYLDTRQDYFDLVIVNLPEVTSSAFNRYYTVEFYESVKASLRDGGIISVSIAGGEGVLGAELVRLGASVQKTLAQVFSNLVLVPGDQTWLVASDSQSLTGDPAILRDRFAAIGGSHRIFPPAGLLSVYQPEVAARIRQFYQKANLPPELLVNRDRRPLTHLYALLLAARQSGASLTRFVTLLALSGWIPFLVPILVFIALRTWALATPRGHLRTSTFDSSFLVFSTGWLGIAMVVILMYAYETQFGSLYLHVGIISSLFMAGLTAGAMVCSVLVRAYRRTRDGVTTNRLSTLLASVLLAHGLVLTMIAFNLAGADTGRQLGHGVFAFAFVLSGLCCGGYWPIAAAQLAGGHIHSGEAGSRLEAADHFGASLGGLATSLLAVPVLGTRGSLLVLIGLLAANIPALVPALLRREPAAPAAEGPRLRQAGYVLFGAVACIVICSNVLAHAGMRLQPALPEHAVRALAQEKQTRQVSVTLEDSGKRAVYFALTDAEQKPAGYILSSADFAPEVRGFGGRLNLALHIDASGTLLDFLVLRSNETPSYLDLLRDWLGSLKGKSLFGRAPFAGINAVTGATISSNAMLRALQTSGRRFAQEVMGGPPLAEPGVPTRSRLEHLPDATAIYLIGAFAAVLGVMHWGGFWSRIVVLALTFLIGGLALNAQYSTEQIATLLTLEAPTARLTGVFLLVVGVPLVVLLFGNLYCGYVCPFGAAQELLGYVLPRRLRPVPSPDQMRLARFLKYAVLTLLIVAFFLSRDRRTLTGDPLISVFGLRAAVPGWPAWMFGVIGVALLGSLFYVRFWCRYLCPVGAFLSLLNYLRLLRRCVPAKWFGKCEFGLTADDHLDCLYCDRCRHPATQALAVPSGADVRSGPSPLALAAVLGGLLITSASLSQFRRVMPLILEEPASTTPAAGQPRDVDARQIRMLLQQHQLSDHKAEYYKQLE
jgi:predicted membrane-bound spermidine synthase/Na+-translocating ferredoxin:NAD+ oxidoreductase RnfG subunit